MMHKESPAEKNTFLEDLDKLDVSIYQRWDSPETPRYDDITILL